MLTIELTNGITLDQCEITYEDKNIYCITYYDTLLKKRVNKIFKKKQIKNIIE
ncbi:MAG: hypothetical protein KFKLKKLM_02637 [Flavobacteriales bacterium]|nr:hypothetical protein [Flavobacteriales bacterium]